MSILSNALWITLIGMGLVFLALVLLWGMMELMMRLTAKSALADEAAQMEAEAESTSAEAASSAASGRAALAAAAAVAVALALQPAPAPVENPVEASGMSVWQAAMRTSRLNQRANQFTRKQRGVSR